MKNEIQTMETAPIVVGGTFTITFPVRSRYQLNGKTVYRWLSRTTAPIPYDADSETIKQAQIKAMSTIKTADGFPEIVKK
jgi:hypothetical protein